MAILSRRLQTRGSCPHTLQQPPPLHGYKKSELQTSPLGSKALALPLLHWLLTRQGQWSCRCSIAIPSAKCQRKSYLSSQKHKDLAPAAVLPSQRFWPFIRYLFSPSPDPHLQNCYSASIAAVLEFFPRRDNQQRPLQCQYRGHKAKTPRPTKQQ